METLTLHAENGGTRIHLHSVLTGRWGDDLLYRGGNIAGWLNWMEAVAAWVERGEAASSEPFGLLGAGLGAEAAGEGNSPAGTRIHFGVERNGKPTEAEVVLAPRTPPGLLL